MRVRTRSKRDHRIYRRIAARSRTAMLAAARYRRRTRRPLDCEAAAPGPKRTPRQSLRLAALVFVQYALLALDIRFITAANYVGIAVANVCIAVTTWYLTKGIVEARSLTDRVCFVAGGAAGAVLAVYVT